MPVVDAWINLNPKEVATEGWNQQTRSSLLRQFHETADVMRQGMTVDELLASMDQAGIDVGVLTTQPFVSTFDELMIACEEIAEACAAHPDRFVGSGRIDILLGHGRLKQSTDAVRRMVEEFNFRAIRVVPQVIELPPDHRDYYPAYAAAVELGVPVTINVGMPGPLRPAVVQQPILLDRVCLDFPELVIVATHMGHPWHEELLSLMIRHQNLYLMTSAWAPRYYPPAVVNFMGSSRSRGRVMFATDYPVLSMQRCADELPLLDLDPEVREEFLWKTADSVFHLGLDKSAG